MAKYKCMEVVPQPPKQYKLQVQLSVYFTQRDSRLG